MLLAAAATLSLCGAAQAASSERLIVRYRSGMTAAEQAGTRANATAGLVHKLRFTPNTEVVLASSAAAAKLKADPRVLSVTSDAAVSLPKGERLKGASESAIGAASNDPYFGQLWGLENTGQYVNGTYGAGDADMDVPEAWTQSTGAGAAVYVADTGIDYTHPDLAANYAGGYDFVSYDSDPMDEQYHGTHVSGTIAASANNGVGVAGVAPNAKIVMLRVLDSTGSGYVSDTVDAINYAADHGARIFSASLGGYVSDPSSQCAAVAAHPNTLFVFAAGNNSANNDYAPYYPASCPSGNVISVAASDQSDWSASFSNYGAGSVDVAAPGTNIYSTIPSGWLCGDVASIYCWLDGTSMATPHVAGEAALLAAKYPTWTAAQIRARIMATVEPRGNWAGRISSGGRVNAALALAPIPQCSDGIDNDGDGRLDYPSDTGCSSPSDDSEYAPPPKCSDGVDNDGDGLIDYPRDPGCSSPSDDDEYNAPPPKPACSDGRDNDGDGLVDYPRDPGCTSASDANEYNAPPARDVKPRLTRVHLSSGSFPVRVYWTQNQTATITVTVTMKSRGHWRTLRTVTLRNLGTGARSVKVTRGSFKRGTYRFSLSARDKAGAVSAVAGYKTLR